MLQGFRGEHNSALLQIALDFMWAMFLHVSMYTLSHFDCQYLIVP